MMHFLIIPTGPQSGGGAGSSGGATREAGGGATREAGEELRGLSYRLGSQEEENSSLVGRLEATLRKLEFSEQEKNVLQVIRKKYIM